MQENQYYEDPMWSEMTNVASGEEEDVVMSNFIQNTTFVSDESADMSYESKMWLPNQGAVSAWYNMNNQELWQEYIQLMYDVVNMGLG